MRLVTALAAWVVAAAATLYVAHHTAAGPVVLTVGPAQGVHLGDIAAGVGAAAWATAITVALVLTAPKRRRRHLQDGQPTT